MKATYITPETTILALAGERYLMELAGSPSAGEPQTPIVP
jgi:hypothetical protein